MDLTQDSSINMYLIILRIKVPVIFKRFENMYEYLKKDNTWCEKYHLITLTVFQI